jgi:hypothetical protein
MDYHQRLVNLFATGTLEGQVLFDLLHSGDPESDQEAAAMDAALTSSFTRFLLTAALLRCGQTTFGGSNDYQ